MLWTQPIDFGCVYRHIFDSCVFYLLLADALLGLAGLFERENLKSTSFLIKTEKKINLKKKSVCDWFFFHTEYITHVTHIFFSMYTQLCIHRKKVQVYTTF